MKTNSLLYLATLIAIACLFLPSATQAASGGLHPPPDGGYAGGNTAEGDNALFSLATGTNNTATGFQSLYNNTTGNFNTGLGSQSLFSNQTTSNNTAVGFQALYNSVG